ncbi:MAG TPA: ABC transporter permease [Bryobacteraceae bacterium]|nr:ABC transporter permease [Bryobacteraceae bacterium]
MLLTSFRIAIKALGRHKLRTALTMLGMTIGVAAVIAMVALGTGARETVSADLESAGTALINVNSGNYTRGGSESNIATGLGAATTLTADDAREISRIAGVKYYSSIVRLRGWAAAGAERTYLQVFGTDASYPETQGWAVIRGKYFKPSDVDSGAAVAVLGKTARDRLFGEDANPVGKQIVIHDQTFRVVGVSGTNDDVQIEGIFVPYTTLQHALDIRYIHGIAVFAAHAGEATPIAAEIRTLLRKRHHLDTADAMERVRRTGLPGNQMPGGPGSYAVPDDFTVKTQAAEALTKGLYTSVAAFILANMPKMDQINMQEMAGTLNRAGATMTALLAAIATISLVVGGIGIMNIMFVAVTERTREIGIRRAVGARSRDILLQFLVEAVTIGMCGGVAGITAGFLTSFAITELLEWPASVSFGSVLLAFGIAGAVAVFFGFYPARRASRLNPINALRYE